MSDYLRELAESAAGLEAASNAAMASLNLTPGNFAWFSGEVRQAMSPQRILPESNLLHDSFANEATFYGGRIANEKGDFGYGNVQASIREHIPEGAKHLDAPDGIPVPYITRDLTLHKGIITVETPTANLAPSDGPAISVCTRGYKNFRKWTAYNTQTGDVTVRSGEQIHGYGGHVDDQTIEQDAFTLPDAILLPRLATVVRTIKAASSIFEKVAWQNLEDVTWEVQKRP